MYSDEVIDNNVSHKEPKNRKNGLIFTSLIFNILLATGGGYLYYQNQQLSSELTEYALRVNELSQNKLDLDQQLNMSMVQLNYYRELTEYYSTISTVSGNSSGIIGQVNIPILAVQTTNAFFQSDSRGFVLFAELELQEGQGRILVNTEVFNGIDMQNSVRTAAIVVEKLLGISFSNTDIILTITGNQQVEAVDGPSAGGAITVALIAALENKQVLRGVYITGTINSDGSLGKVGGVPYKALAAAEEEADLIIVPVGQGNVILYEPRIVRVGRFTYTTYEKVAVKLEDYLYDNGYSVDVVEISSVLDAFRLLTGQSL